MARSNFYISMTLSNHWQPAYDRLRGFIANQPAITMDASGVSIPADYRDDFYRHFDDARRAFVADNYSALPPAIELLSKNYIRLEEQVLALLKLDGIDMPIDLFTFLHHPVDGVMRTIYNRLFDLLQDKISQATFDSGAASDVRSGAADLLRLGYEMWAALAIIKALDPDRAYQVALNDEDKPIPTELKSISFGRQIPHLTFRLPEFILYSRKIRGYVAIKLQLITEIATYASNFVNPLGKRRRTGDTSFALDSRVMLLSIIPSLEAIPIVADLAKQSVSKPDFMIECLAEADIHDPAVQDQLRQRYDIFRPTQGAYLILREPVAASALNQIGENIHPLSIGFDETKLQSIFNTILT